MLGRRFSGLVFAPRCVRDTFKALRVTTSSRRRASLASQLSSSGNCLCFEVFMTPSLTAAHEDSEPDSTPRPPMTLSRCQPFIGRIVERHAVCIVMATT